LLHVTNGSFDKTSTTVYPLENGKSRSKSVLVVGVARHQIFLRIAHHCTSVRMLSFGGQIDGHLALSVSMTGPFGSYFSLRKAFLSCFVRNFPCGGYYFSAFQHSTHFRFVLRVSFTNPCSSSETEREDNNKER